MLKRRLSSPKLTPIWYVSIGQGYANIIPGYVPDECFKVDTGMVRVLLDDGPELTYTKVVVERVFLSQWDANRCARSFLHKEIARLQSLLYEIDSSEVESDDGQYKTS